MRIALWHNLPWGGAKRALYDQVSGLLNSGHQLESWCPPSADQEFFPLSDLVPEHIVEVGHVQSSKTKHLWELTHDTDVQVEAMNRHCQQCARDIHLGGFDVLFAGTCMEFGVTAIPGTWTCLRCCTCRSLTAYCTRPCRSRPGRPMSARRAGGAHPARYATS